MIERSFGWATRFRRLGKDYERYASTLADLHLAAFVSLAQAGSATGRTYLTLSGDVPTGDAGTPMASSEG